MPIFDIQLTRTQDHTFSVDAVSRDAASEYACKMIDNDTRNKNKIVWSAGSQIEIEDITQRRED